jgi:NAD(P)-dependent dehydrogenase (short-subunit alcohol dehydrogenase family)
MKNQDRKRIALVTGANKGIGHETAGQLAADTAAPITSAGSS